MDWIFDYSVLMANGDGDEGEWTEELFPEELEKIADAVIDGTDFEEAVHASGLYERVYNAVLSDIGGNLMDSTDLSDEEGEDAAWIYDEGCDVEITPEDPDVTDDAFIEALIKRAVKRSKAEGTGVIHDVLSRYGKLYSDDAAELALGYAVQLRAHAYLHEVRSETEEEEAALPAAAVAAEDAPAGEGKFYACRYAVRSDSWKILAFTKAFQEEVFQTLLDENDLEREDVVAFLEGTAEEPEYKGDLKRTLRAIGVFPYGGDVAFENMLGEDGAEVTELIDWLGIPTLTDRSTGTEIYYID